MVERVLVDEGGVTALVPDALELHVAEVVAVHEHLVDVLDGDGTSRPLGRGWDAQAATVEFIPELTHGPGAAGVGLEHPLDERGSIRVNGDRTNLASVDPFADVEVAERGESGSPAHAGLLAHPLLGLHGQVRGVELGDGRHDAVQQLAGGRVVDVLGGGHQLCACVANGDVDRYVVLTGSCQPIHLVDNDVGDVHHFPKELEHELQLRSVGRLR
ncbi:hypothetical protein VSS16_31280 [Streptomyces broussonetiae]|uniref:Uncharacterized protein n=1 Tax=Streptomyces broussonetiae TaxID=2686304 RepID=A0ABV5EKI3_9ACTN